MTEKLTKIAAASSLPISLQPVAAIARLDAIATRLDARILERKSQCQ